MKSTLRTMLAASLLLAFGNQLSSAAASPEKLSLMPLPSSAQTGTGAFPLSPDFHAAYAGFHDKRLDAGLARMLASLQFDSGIPLARTAQENASGAGLLITVAGPGQPVQGPSENESYDLSVTAQQVRLNAATVVGALHGMETLLQLVECSQNGCVLPAVTIHDTPRFPWRGLMIDCSRHFEPIAVIKRTLDGMAVVKLNVFHWHLSDDQGFRAESKRFPKLTGMGSGGEFYTQDEMRDVVSYARARGIRVVPEFDIPGHATSWLVGYPELGSAPGPYHLETVFGIHNAVLDPTRESTYKFLDALVGEMAAIFPDPYMHIGGDENNGNDWRQNAHISAFMQQKGMKDTAALQAYFNQRLLPILQKHGKKMIGWDEVLTPGLPKDVVVQSWRGEASLAQGAAQGYQGILSAPYYLDAMKSSEANYLADPVPADSPMTPEQRSLILGGEVCMWAEQLNSRTIDSRIWPRTAAVAERLWSPADKRDVADMYRRLETTSLRLEEVGLTHISGPAAMRRSLAGSLHPVALDLFASVLEPVSFSDRYQGQHTSALTPLDRLVDAVVPDPPSRHAIQAEVNAVTSHSPEAALSTEVLQERFRAWQNAVPELSALTSGSPRMNDATPRVTQLGQLAGIGLEALAFLRSGERPPDGWEAAQLQTITAAEKPIALVRFTFLPALRELVSAAAGGTTAH